MMIHYLIEKKTEKYLGYDNKNKIENEKLLIISYKNLRGSTSA